MEAGQCQQHTDDIGAVNSDDPQPDPLGGKSSVSDTFAGIFKLSASLGACMHALCMSSSPSDRSEHELVFLVGEFGGWSTEHLLMCSCVTSRIRVYCNAMQVTAHVWHAHTASGFDLDTSPHSNR